MEKAISSKKNIKDENYHFLRITKMDSKKKYGNPEFFNEMGKDKVRKNFI